MKKRTIKLFWLATLLVSLVSCRREDLSWDSHITLPLLTASLDLEDVVADSLIESDASGGLRLVYRTKLEALSGDSFFVLPDTTLINRYSLPFGNFTLNPGDFLVNNTTQTSLAISPAQLVYAIIEDGLLYVNMRNDIMKRVKVTYQVLSATRNGIPLDTSFIIPAAPSATTPAYANAVLDLSGYEVSFTGTLGDRTNTIVSTFIAQIDPTETGTVLLLPADTVEANTTYSEVTPWYVRGYFGNESIQVGPETSAINFFNRFVAGGLGLDSLNMKLTIENYAGIDLRVTLNDIWSVNNRTGQTEHLSHPVMGSPVNINRAYYSSGWPPSVPQISTFNFNNGNSNAKDLVQILPDELGYDITLITNPLGNVSGNNDFLFPKYGINGYIDVDMPINFYADSLTMEDTVITDFTVENEENVLRADLFLHADNGFPLKAGVQIYLLNDLGAVIDSIVVAPGSIESAPVALNAGYYEATGTTHSVVTISLNEYQTHSLLNSSKVLIRSTFDTNSIPNHVKIYNTSRLELKLTSDFVYRVQN